MKIEYSVPVSWAKVAAFYIVVAMFTCVTYFSPYLYGGIDRMIEVSRYYGSWRVMTTFVWPAIWVGLALIIVNYIKLGGNLIVVSDGYLKFSSILTRRLPISDISEINAEISMIFVTMSEGRTVSVPCGLARRDLKIVAQELRDIVSMFKSNESQLIDGASIR